MKERKLDIFRVLKQADVKNTTFYTSLDETERKAFQPFLVIRWLSGTYDSRQIYFLNEFVNHLAFSLTKHHQLLWQLLTVCTSGKSQRYSWNKLPAKANITRPASTKVVAAYYNYSQRDAAEALQCLSGNDVLDIAGSLGLQTEDLAKIRKEYKGEKLQPDDLKITKKIKQPIDQHEFFTF